MVTIDFRVYIRELIWHAYCMFITKVIICKLYSGKVQNKLMDCKQQRHIFICYELVASFNHY